MATDVQISCINKPDRKSRNEAIQNVGGIHNGEKWKISEAQAIAYIENGTYRFWTAGGGTSTWVVIATRNGRKYLKTEADTTTKDNLLSLPECPA